MHRSLRARNGVLRAGDGRGGQRGDCEQRGIPSDWRRGCQCDQVGERYTHRFLHAGIRRWGRYQWRRLPASAGRH